MSRYGYSDVDILPLRYKYSASGYILRPISGDMDLEVKYRSLHGFSQRTINKQQTDYYDENRYHGLASNQTSDQPNFVISWTM